VIGGAGLEFSVSPHTGVYGAGREKCFSGAGGWKKYWGFCAGEG
jgi:hypothetical protein